ncbi:MAG: hypothetical protein KDD55_04425 [Bdellovibrionales bacterium]|nr:hypothetical protein [Bdellovibrionales bacterium]
MRFKNQMLLLAGALLLPLSVAIATPLSTVQIRVLDENTQAKEGVAVEARQNGTAVDFADTNAQGFANFYTLEPGTYDFVATPGYSYNCDDCAAYTEAESEVTVARSGGNYTAGNDSYDAGDLQLALGTILLDITVKDQNNQPAPNLYISGFIIPEYQGGGGGGGDGSGGGGGILSSDVEYFSGQTDNTGGFLAAVSPGRWFINTYSQDGMYADSFKEVVIPEGNGTTQLQMIAKATDSTITISIVDEDGNPVTVASGSYASVSCYDENYTSWFFTDFQSGQSEATVNVVGGTGTPITYICDFYSEGGGAAPTQVDVTSGDDAEGTITILSTDCRIHVRLQDSDGNTVTGLDGSADAFTVPEDFNNPQASIFHYAGAYQPNQDGIYELEVICGITYDVNFFQFQDFGSGDTGAIGDYINANFFQSITTSEAASPQTVTFTLLQADATMNVTVLDENGSPSANTWVDVFSDSSPNIASITKKVGRVNSEEVGIFAGGITDQNGEVVIPIVSGIPYRVSAWLDSAFSFDGNAPTVLNPQPQQVNAQAGENAVTLQALEPDFTLTITPNAPEALDWVFCAVYSRVVNSFADASGGTATIGLLSTGGPYTIFCDGAAGATFYSSGPVSYTVPDGQETASTSVDMSEGGSYYEPESVTFDPSSAQTLTLPDDCSTMTIPANTFTSNGNITVTYGTNTDAVPFSDAASPLGSLFDIKVADNQGELIQPAQGKTFTLTLCYDENDLPEGLEEDQITCIESNEQGNGLSAASCDVDTEANTVKFTIDHLSDFGINRAESVVGGLGAVGNFKVKKKNGCKGNDSKRKLTFNQVDGASSYKITGTRTKKSKTKQFTKTVNHKGGKSKGVYCLKTQNKWTYSVTVRPVDDSEVTGAASTVLFKVKKNGNAKEL